MPPKGKRSSPGRSSGDRQQDIIEATFRILARDTISGARMPPIATEAGVSQGTLHYYFETKENLLLRVLEWLISPIGQLRGVTSGVQIEAPPTGDRNAARKALVEWIRLIVEQESDSTRVFYDFFVQAAARPGELRDAMRGYLRTYRGAIKSLLVENDVDAREAEVIAAVVIGLIEGVGIQLTLDPKAFSLDRYLAMADEVIGQLVANAKRKPRARR